MHNSPRQVGSFSRPERQRTRGNFSDQDFFFFFIDAETFWRPVFLTPIFLLRCPLPVNDMYINPSRH